jgi:hypothetical protein
MCEECDCQETEYQISDSNPEVRLGYNSSRNISFRGTEETGYSRKEWDEMSQKDKDMVIQDLVNELVEVYELGDGEPDVY